MKNLNAEIKHVKRNGLILLKKMSLIANKLSLIVTRLRNREKLTISCWLSLNKE